MKLLLNPFQSLNSANLASAFSSRASGNMSLSYGDTSGALDNRKKFLGPLGINYGDLVCAKQAHGNNVKYVTAADKGSGALTYETAIPDTDGLITDTRNLPLAIFTADCLSIFLYDPVRPAVGLIHAGWRGTQENIVLRAIGLMRERFKAKPAELYAGFGPAIRNCCYEVTAEFKDNFRTGLIEQNGRFYLDIARVNNGQLVESGVRAENILDSGFCTSCDNAELFSFRKEGKESGRMLSVIMLK